MVHTVRKMRGNKGVYYLVDRKTGKSPSITLWASEQDLQATEQDANRVRAQSAQAGGRTIVSVERFEVAVAETDAS